MSTSTQSTNSITVYAHWKQIEPKIKQPIEDIIATYGTYFEKQLTLEMFVKNASELSVLNIEYDNLRDLPAGLNLKESHIKGIPTEAGDITAKISVVCILGEGAEIGKIVEVTFKVNTAPLTITPKSNQKLFEGETIEYEVKGAVNNETPEFTGSLGVESGKVVNNSLALTTEFAQNYSLSLTPDFPITIINKETAKSLVQLSGTTNANGAYIDEVTVTAPDGFLIALESSQLKSPLNYSKSFTWNQKGTSILNYKLKRISDSRESDPFSMEITVVKSQDITDPDDDDDNDYDDNDEPQIVEYTIEIPEVEGISIDKGFGEHWVEAWNDFSFIITVKEGYVKNSDPEVTIKGYDFAFDALTDSTYECKIDRVHTNVEVIITGIVKDPPPTANNAIKAPEESWKIMNGVAYITVAKPTIFKVVEINGNITIYNLSPGVTPIYNLPKANVLLFSFDGKKAEKVIISNK